MTTLRQATSLSARPLIPVATALAAGIALVEIPFGPWIATGGALAGLVMASLTRRVFWRTMALLLGFLAAGTWRASLAASPAADDVSRFIGAGYVTVRGTVVSDVDVTAHYLLCQVEAVRVVLPDGRSFDRRGRVTMRLRRKADGDVLDYGDTVEARGPLERPDTARNPGGFDRAVYLSRHQVFATLAARRESAWRVVPAVAPPTVWLPRLANRCRASLEQTFHALLPPLEADLLAGILLGRRTRLPPLVNDDFTATGTGHILASSGMNVAMIAGWVAPLCRLLHASRRLAALVILSSLAFYTLMVGARPSILRAALMASLFLLGYLLDREGDGPSALAAAALILLAFQPGNLFDAGFQLSFVIVAAIFATMPIFVAAWERRKRPDFAPSGRGASRAERLLFISASALALTVIAQVAAAPLTAQHFNQVSLIGFLANALILPLIALLFAAGFLIWGVGMVWFGGAKLLAAALLSLPLAYLLGAARACADLPGAVFSVPSPGWPLIGLYYAAFGAGVWWFQARRTERGG